MLFNPHLTMIFFTLAYLLFPVTYSPLAIGHLCVFFSFSKAEKVIWPPKRCFLNKRATTQNDKKDKTVQTLTLLTLSTTFTLTPKASFFSSPLFSLTYSSVIAFSLEPFLATWNCSLVSILHFRDSPLPSMLSSLLFIVVCCIGIFHDPHYMSRRYILSLSLLSSSLCLTFLSDLSVHLYVCQSPFPLAISVFSFLTEAR